MILFF
jgi:hypothetical protein